MKKIFALYLFYTVISLTMTITYAAVSLVKIDSITYVRNEGGVTGEKYNGWAKSSDGEKRLFYVDGIRATGVVTMDNGERCYFDKDGVFLNKRSSENGYNIVFDNDYTVKLSDGKIAFHVAISDLKGKDHRDFGASPFFDLYVYKDGRWVHIPYVDGDFPAYEVSLSDDNLMHFSMVFNIFDYKFEPGLYRVKVAIDNREFDENGKSIPQIVRGEFNISES